VTANPGGLDEAGAYSPNGKRLVFARFSDLTSESSGLYVVRLSDGALRAIAPAGSSLSSSGDWSTQGNQIVYSRRLGEDVRSAIWIVHANGSGLHRLVVDGLGCGGAFSDPSAASCLDPHWSPDGTKLVFQGITPESGSNIYTVNADGTGLRQLTHSGSDNFPDWGVHPLA
jgi:Tol biopolymer transport system component